MAEQKTDQGLSEEELSDQNAEALPDREAMSVITPDPGSGLHNLELGDTPTPVPDKGPVDDQVDW